MTWTLSTKKVHKLRLIQENFRRHLLVVEGTSEQILTKYTGMFATSTFEPTFSDSIEKKLSLPLNSLPSFQLQVALGIYINRSSQRWGVVVFHAFCYIFTQFAFQEITCFSKIAQFGQVLREGVNQSLPSSYKNVWFSRPGRTQRKSVEHQQRDVHLHLETHYAANLRNEKRY